MGDWYLLMKTQLAYYWGDPRLHFPLLLPLACGFHDDTTCNFSIIIILIICYCFQFSSDCNCYVAEKGFYVLVKLARQS